MADEISSNYGDNFNPNPHSSLQPIDSTSNISSDEKKLHLTASNQIQEFEAMVDGASFSSPEETLEKSVDLPNKIQNLDAEVETNVGSVCDFEMIGAVEDGNQEVANQDCAKDELVQEVQLFSGVEVDGKEGFVRTEDLSTKEGTSESILEMKKKLLLEELDAMLVPAEEIHLEKGNTIPHSLGGMVENCARTVLIDGENTNVIRRSHLSLKNSLKFEVIDETALVEPVHVSKIGNVEEVGIVFPTRSMQIGVNESQESDRGVTKAKRSRRKAAREAKIPVVHLNLRNDLYLDQVNERKKNADGNKIVYSKKDMEALRFENVAEQKRLWKAICKELMPAVAREYSSLTSSNRPRKMGSTSGTIREGCSENLDGEIEDMEGDNEIVLSEPSCNLSVREDSDDDGYYNSIQRPAFLVEGEPNFDSGPPEDGLEFLRRARWEASRIPNVTVAKVDRSSFKKEQSVYMPVIPAIAKCPEHLRTSKEWEDALLADFSKLRQALSCVEGSEHEQSDFIHHEKFDSTIPDLIVQPSVVFPANGIDSQQPDEENSSNGYPSFSAISKMNSVFRVSSLRKRINSFETQTTLSRTDCLWLFALSAAVDTPLDADTCAIFRSLLRKCASLRAEKTEPDDEVIMLNILATISGRYFGQSEN